MATRAEPLRLPRSGRGRVALMTGCLVALVGWRAIDGWSADHMFLINRSGSLPNWAYLVDRHGEPARDGPVFFTPPPGPLVKAHFGADPAPFGKIVYGMPGDVVRHVGNQVYVGDRLVARMKPLSHAGEVLVPGPTGRIPDNCYYVGSGHPDGFDSRYAAIGFICRNRIVGTGVASVL